MAGKIGFIPGLDESPATPASPGLEVSSSQPQISLSDARKAADGKKTKKRKQEDEQKETKIFRAAGGAIWEDPTLAGWDSTHFRIFVGDLAKEVSDEQLFQAFSSAFPSTSKARVVRDRHTGRSKGYGFVSIKAEQEFREAMRTMHGKYIGNRPVKLKKSNWADRNVADDKQVRQLKDVGFKMKK